jgi:6-phosphogluconolactonase
MDVKKFKKGAWAFLSAELIHNSIRNLLVINGTCNVMLTGGRSASLLYAAWKEHFDISTIKGANFYFGDERCVPHSNADSNYSMAKKVLFSHNQNDFQIFHMGENFDDLEIAAKKYEACLPNQIDILLLGVGIDGHIASIFPGSKAFEERVREVMPIISPVPPKYRLTITPTVIYRAKKIFILAPGFSKEEVFQRAVNCKDAPIEFPISMVKNAIWLMEKNAR